MLLITQPIFRTILLCSCMYYPDTNAINIEYDTSCHWGDGGNYFNLNVSHVKFKPTSMGISCNATVNHVS